MNRHNTAILAGAVVAAMAIIAIASMVPHTSGNVSEDANIIGHWYLVHYEYYDEEGNGQSGYISVDPDISLRDMDIYQARDGMFSGMFMSTNIAGTFYDGKIDFGTIIGDTKYSGHGGILDDGHLIFMLTETTYQDATPVDTRCYSMTYAMTREIADRSADEIDISGRWTSFNTMWYDGTVTDLGSATAIVSQSGELVRVDLRGENLNIKLEGALSSKSDGTAVGYLANPQGDSWRMMLRNSGVLELGCALDYKGELGTLTAYMSRDGSPVDEPVVMDLEGTSWRSISNSTWDMFGNSVHVSNKYYVEFTTQVGNSIMGGLHSGPNFYPLAVYLNPGPDTRVNYSVWYGAGTLLTSDGWISGDRMYTAESRYMFGMMVSSITSFDKISDESREQDITGHWYMSSYIGYSDGDAYEEYNQDGREKISDYDLDIYEIRDGLLFGRYLGANVTGSYIGGIISIVCTNHVDGGTATVEGWVMDDNTMTLNEVYATDRPEGHMNNDVFSTILSRDGGASINEEVLADMVGEWRLLSGYVFNGTALELSEMRLNIEEYRHNVFYGTMDRVIGHNIVNVGIHGVLTANTMSGEASGMMAGSSGGVWNTYLDDGTFTVKLVGKRTLGDVSTMSTSVCTFVKADDDRERASIDQQHLDLEGDWKAVSITAVSDTGTWSTEDYNYTIEIETQYGVSAVGSGHQPGLEGRFSLVMTTNVYGDVSIAVASDYGFGSIDRGIGWIDTSDLENLRVYIVETYKNVGGHWTTQLTCFERYLPMLDSNTA